jgi:hypothetical protein
MLSRRLITTTCAAVAMLATLSVTDANAQLGGPVDSRTEFTFNRPVELPGVTLPPGTYVFRFADATTSRQVMHVMAKDATNKTYGLFLTVQAQRPEASREAELRFMETPAGAPAAIKTWWYPDTRIGREFIYPKAQARRLAQATNTSVLTTQAESVTNEQMKTADLTYVSPSGQETAVTDGQMTDAAAAAPTSAARTFEQTPVQEGTSAANTAGRTRLPRTNSALPLIGLLGLASLLSGAALRFRR